jgi:hypothetical protein
VNGNGYGYRNGPPPPAYYNGPLLGAYGRARLGAAAGDDTPTTATHAASPIVATASDPAIEKQPLTYCRANPGTLASRVASQALSLLRPLDQSSRPSVC